jgi:hypothetical protein
MIPVPDMWVCHGVELEHFFLSWIWRRVVWYTATNVSEELSAPILPSRRVQNVVRKVCTYLPDCTEPLPKKTMIPLLNFPLISNNKIQRNSRPNLSARREWGRRRKTSQSGQSVFQLAPPFSNNSCCTDWQVVISSRDMSLLFYPSTGPYHDPF